MFERRLKILIGFLMLLTLLLLGRVFAVQVVEHSYWSDKADGMLTKPQVTETTRGRILDVHGNVLALDTACTDACVDYRAIIDPPDPVWLKELVKERVKRRFGSDYHNARPEQRTAMFEDEKNRAVSDINSMWDVLAQLNPQTAGSDNPRAAIEEIRKAIVQSVQMRRQALTARNQQRDQARASTASRLMRWLSGSDASMSDDPVGALEEEQAPHVVIPALDAEKCNFLGKHPESFPGLVLRASVHREYPQKTVACHLLGSLSHVSANDLIEARRTNLDELRQYLPNDSIGRSGVEALCEPLLRGTRGKIERRVSDSAIISTQDFVPGSDVHLSIDIDLQKQAQDLLQHVEERIINDDTHQRELITPEGGVSMHGAVVVLDVKTNEVRVLASNPGFDLNELQNHYTALAADELDQPLVNRATSDTLEPGSTVKPVVGLGAITQGVLGPTETIKCTGFLFLPEISPNGVTRMVRVPGAARCWILSENPNRDQYIRAYGAGNLPADAMHGPLTYAEALMRSCDIFFETAADRLTPAGVDHWLDEFGLGRPTGIGIFERSGARPGSFKNVTALSRADNCLAGMGQGMVLATPLQIANEAATIARGGIWMRPRLLTAESQEALDSVQPHSDKPDTVDLHLSPEALAQAKIGMMNVVDGPAGTGKIEHTGFTLAAKTGTADAAHLWVKTKDADGKIIHQKLMPVHPHGDEGDTPWYRSTNKTDPYGVVHSWYMGYAPADNPRIAFCVLIEYAGAGGSVAAGPVASHMLEACSRAGYLGGSDER